LTTSRRTFLGVTVGAAAATIVHPLTNAVSLSDEGSTPSAVPLLRVRAAPDQVQNSVPMVSGLCCSSTKIETKRIPFALSLKTAANSDIFPARFA
jgi:hypothetical protein